VVARVSFQMKNKQYEKNPSVNALKIAKIVKVQKSF
jgi:hypothetical protein